jgi:hypothetical protein
MMQPITIFAIAGWLLAAVFFFRNRRFYKRLQGKVDLLQKELIGLQKCSLDRFIDLLHKVDALDNDEIHELETRISFHKQELGEHNEPREGTP